MLPKTYNGWPNAPSPASPQGAGAFNDPSRVRGGLGLDPVSLERSCAVSPALLRYLDLEQMMLRLAEAGDPQADAIRDLMDPLWYQLTDEDRKLLDAREEP